MCGLKAGYTAEWLIDDRGESICAYTPPLMEFSRLLDIAAEEGGGWG